MQPGDRLGPYEILSALGVGGMGEVYRARDPKLQRDVAIKVLPQLLAADPDRLARFEREAQLLASVNHGNIAHVYGLADLPPDAGSHHALVMELVEGRPLDALIPSGGMPVRDALSLAIQMADALAAAHAAGVVHRDFKPGNVVVTPAGTAKVLDFGLAKPVEIGVGAGIAETALAGGLRTEAGMVVGTSAYMSPEQAVGRQVDSRSDVFSFGSVLFEMLTGKRAFERDTTMSTLASIINEPALPVSQVNATVPRELERVIARCHRKDPARRVQSMADLRSALEELRDDLEAGKLSGPVAVPVVRAGWRALRYVALAAVALALVATGAVIARTWLTPAVPKDTGYRLDAMTADIGVTRDPAVTANGELLAYASDRHDATNLDIWVQPTAGGEPVRVTTDPADDLWPSFSPDGSRIAFRSERDGGGIYVVPALGGSERLLVPFGRSPQYSPDGKWLLYFTGGRGRLQNVFIMPAGGGPSQRFLSEYVVNSLPVWTADGRSIAVRGRRIDAATYQIVTINVDDRGIVAGPARETGVVDAARAAGLELQQPVGWRDGELWFTTESTAGGEIWRVGLDDGPTAAVRHVYGGPEAISRAVVAASGRIFFSGSATRASIASIEIDATRPVAAPPVEMTRSVARDTWPSLSADGARLAFASTRAGGSVWIREVASGRETRLPVPPGASSPVISPDGRGVAYAVGDTVWVVDTRGGIPREICQKCARWISSWSADGQQIVAQFAAGADSSPGIIEVATGQFTTLVPQRRAWFGRLSPDRRWFTFFEWPQADRTREIVARYTAGAPIAEAALIPVTDGQSVDETAAWSPDGRILYFPSERDGFRCLYASRFDPAAGKVLGPPEPILHMHGNRRTVVDTSANPSRIDVAGGRLVFSLQEVVGNIWSLTPR